MSLIVAGAFRAECFRFLQFLIMLTLLLINVNHFRRILSPSICLIELKELVDPHITGVHEYVCFEKFRIMI